MHIHESRGGRERALIQLLSAGGNLHGAARANCADAAVFHKYQSIGNFGKGR
jgi:hypothetical protein